MVLKAHRWAARSIAVAILASVGACLGTSPPPRLPVPAPVVVVVHLERADGDAVAVPDAVWQAIAGTLRARNLEPTRLDDGVLGPARTSEARLEALRAAHRDASWLVLIEARARFFSQLSGRYRWEVEVRSSVIAPGGQSQSDLSVAAFLPFEREREPEALAFVRPQLAEDLGALVDRLIAR